MAIEEQSGGAEAGESRLDEATRREVDLAAQRREAEERHAERLVHEQQARTEAHRREWEQSDAARVHRQIDESERLMRGPTPVSHTIDVEGKRQEPGHVPGDPSKGPSH